MRQSRQQGRWSEPFSRSESHEGPDRPTCTASSEIGSWMPFSAFFTNGEPVLSPLLQRYHFHFLQACFSGRQVLRTRPREISDSRDYLPCCSLWNHRNCRRSLWPTFHTRSAPAEPVLGLVAAVRGSHLQLDHRWNCSQQTTGGYNECVRWLVRHI